MNFRRGIGCAAERGVKTIDLHLVAVGLFAISGILISALATGLFDAGTPREPSEHSAPVPRTLVSVAPGAAVLPPSQGKAGAPVHPAPGFTHFRVGERNVKRILVDGGKIWVGTSGGVIRYDPANDEFKLYDIRSGLEANGIVHVGKLQGRVAVGTLGGGLSVLDGQTDRWETFGVADGLPDAVVHDVLEASNGDVWIATRSGVARIRGGALRERASLSHFVAAGDGHGLPSNRVYALAEGKGGDVWAGTEAGVALYRNGAWRHGGHAGGGTSRGGPALEAGAHGGQGASGSSVIVAVAVDRAGVVWAGTLGGGLLRFDGSKWRRYTSADGLPGDHVFTLHQDADNLLWVGTDNGLARMKDGKFTVMTRRDGLFSNAVFAMASAPDALWVGSYGGVARIRANP